MRRSTIAVLACLAVACASDAPATDEAPVQSDPKAALDNPASGAKEAVAAAAKPGAPGDIAGPPGGADLLERMRADLRYLMTAQEVHFVDQMRYATDASELVALGYQTGDGVTVRVVEGSDRGWSAVATSSALPGRGCAVFVGEAARPTTPGGRALDREAFPVCDP